MKTYEAIYEPNKNKGVYGISLVENPAMEGMFIALSEQKIQLKTLDEEKRILVGLVLEPNKPIYRNQNGEEFNIVFSGQTVEDLCYGFSKNKNQSNSTIEHNENQRIEGVTFVENWLVRDEKIDTSVALGLECKKDSWVSVMKVDSDDVWNDYVKTGKVQGFSIDAILSLREVKLEKNYKKDGTPITFSGVMLIRDSEVTYMDGEFLENGTHQLMTDVEIDVVNGKVTDIREVNFKSEINMSNQILEMLKDLPTKIALALNPNKEEKEIVTELGEIKSAQGDVTIMFEGDEMKVGGKVWIVAEDGTEVPLPVGDYELEGGAILVVAEEGVIAEVKGASAEEEKPVEQKPAEMTAVETDATAKAIENAIKSIMIKYSEDNKKVIDELRAELKSTKDELVELSKQPASKPIKSAPTQSEPTTAKGRLFNELQNL